MKDYQIVRSVGRGTTAEVFEARDAEGRRVAVKIFPPGYRALQWHAWAEADVLSKLDHPAILKVHHFGEDEGRPYVAMEFIDGPSLEARVRDKGPIFQGDAVRMVRRIAEALAHAHRAGLYHGEVRPKNVLLRGGNPLDPVLCDFGLGAQGTEAGDVAALADLLRFAAGDHPLVPLLRRSRAELVIAEIDRFLEYGTVGREMPRRRGCLGI
jgi:serine/threonine-protein kinase